MEDITQIIKKQQELLEKRQSLTYLMEANEVAQTMQSLLFAFSPSRQADICLDLQDCIMGNYPTFAEVNKSYKHEKAANIWIIPQITNIVEFSNSSKLINKEVVKELASLIASEYYYLKISEFMLFCRWFKLGKYGRFYGSVDPMIITSALRSFIADRNALLESYEREEERKRFEEEAKRNPPISREEWQRIKENKQISQDIRTITAMYNPEYTTI